jgi:hypothetical protein
MQKSLLGWTASRVIAVVQVADLAVRAAEGGEGGALAGARVEVCQTPVLLLASRERAGGGFGWLEG